MPSVELTPKALSYEHFGTDFSPGFDFDYEKNVITVEISKFPRLIDYVSNIPILNPVQLNGQEDSQDPFSDEALKKRYLHAIIGTKLGIKDHAQRMYLGVVNFLVETEGLDNGRTVIRLAAIPNLYTRAKYPAVVFTASISPEQMAFFNQDKEYFFLWILDEAKKLNED